MRVCLIMPNVFPVPATKGGATETLMTNLLKENEKEGKIDFTCVSVYEENAERLSKQYQHTKFIYIDQKRDNLDLTFKSKDTFFKTYMDEIKKQIHPDNYDFIIVEGGDISGYEYLLKHFPKEKCLVHIHGIALGDNKINKEIYHKFIAISKFTCGMIKKDGQIKDNQIELLYNAIDVNEFYKTISEEEKRELRKKNEIDEKDTVILFIGRTIPEKGVKELISSFRNMRNIERCKLLIVGSANYGERVKTPYDYELEKIAEPIKDKIKFTGFIDNHDLYKIQNIADIAVVPSMFEEAFCLAVVEAMASGLPVITTDSGAIPEIVDDTRAFMIKRDEELIQNMTEKLELLSQDEELRRKMGQNGKKIAEKYNEHHYYLEFCKTIEEIDKNNK